MLKMDIFPTMSSRLSLTEREETWWDLLNQEKIKGYIQLWRITDLLEKIRKYDPNFSLNMLPSHLSECLLHSGRRLGNGGTNIDSRLSEKLMETITALSEARAELNRQQEVIVGLKLENNKLRDHQMPEGIKMEKALGMTMLTVSDESSPEVIITLHPAANLIQIYPPDQGGIKG